MSTPYPLGANLYKDQRSRAFPHITTTTQLITRWWRHYGPILNQGDTGSCTGHGPTQLLNTAPWHRPRTTYLTDQDARTWYGDNTEIDTFAGTWPPDDTGSSLLAAMKTGQKYGKWKGYRWVFTGAQGVAEALQAGPVVMATTWLEQMFYPDANGVLNVSGNSAGGHCYFIHRYTVTTRRFSMINSWGPEWGLTGHAWFNWDDLDRLLEDDGECAQPIL
jgi:hypothetical protein